MVQSLLLRSLGDGGTHDVYSSFPSDSQPWARGLETSFMGLWMVLLVSVTAS